MHSSKQKGANQIPSKRRPVLWDAGSSLAPGSVPVVPEDSAKAADDGGAPGPPCWKDAPEGGGGGKLAVGLEVGGEAWCCAV